MAVELGRPCYGFALALAIGLNLSVAQPVQADTPWSLRLPKEEAVVYQGMVSLDAAGTQGAGMLYPAPNVGGLIAAIITHGILVESQKNSEKQKLQDAANKVLAPYRAVLVDFKNAALMQAALGKTPRGRDGRLIGSSDEPGADWLVESNPSFSMTQDQRALVLDNVVSAYRPGEPTKPAYQAMIRVVSQPRPAQDLESHWKENDGAELKNESTSLLAHSLDLALGDATRASAEGTVAFKTVRYQEGEAQKMERAQIVSQTCQRQIVRTLRGWLLSVPTVSSADSSSSSTACEPALPGWK